MSTPAEWLTIGQLAVALDADPNKVRDLVHRGKVPYRKGATKADTLYSVHHVRLAILAPIVDATPRQIARAQAAGRIVTRATQPEVIYLRRGTR